MPAERYYTPLEFCSGAEIPLEKAEHHHLAHVMRAKVGESVELINGKGAFARAKVVVLDRKRALLEVTSSSQAVPSSRKIILYQAIPRMNRLDTIVEKCTELGVTDIVLWPAALSERKKLSEDQLERLRQVAVSAIKQCGRFYLPNIQMIQTMPKRMPGLYFGDIDPNAPHLSTMDLSGDTGFVIGPESGLTENEIKQLKEAEAVGVSLHKNILRTDTAAITAVAFISTFC